MSRYRKVDPRFWKDEKISGFTPDEKLVALYLFTAQSNRIGIFSFSIGAAAEDVGTSSQTFAEHFASICSALNWEWDERCRVLYIPTWWKYNQPENANNVIGNLKDIDDVPSSNLVTKFVENLQYLRPDLHETFTQTLKERYAQHYPKRLRSQEQKQDKNIGAGAPFSPQSTEINQCSKPPNYKTAPARTFEEFYEAYPKKRARESALQAWRRLNPDDALATTIIKAVENRKGWEAAQRSADANAFIEPWPNPGSWLNGKRWTDELGPIKQRNTPADRVRELTKRILTNPRRQNNERYDE